MDVPAPSVRPGWVLVETRCSLISAGTERTKIETGQKNLLDKARARPDLARKVVDQARVQGVRATYATVRDRLDARAPIGYSCAGIVREVGQGVEGLGPGDRVACGGAGWANHAELVVVPKNLVVPLPENVSFEAGAYATVGSIALHGVRQGEPAVGEALAVIGLGLVGQLAVQILRAAGCRVVGIDVDPEAVRRAAEAGALAITRDDPALEARVREFTSGLGLDGALLCAATKSNDPLELAAHLARDRGRIVVVGDVPIQVDRALLYDKELELRLSRSYGPGRYDVEYEERGRDLPPGYVRWTEQRNMRAFVDLAAGAQLKPEALTTHRFSVEAAADAYEVLSTRGGTRPFGIVLEYPREPAPRPQPPLPPRRGRNGVRIGLLGAGNFARGTLVPGLRAAGADLALVASGSGLAAADAADRLGFSRAVTTSEILAAEDIDAVVIATRHGSHASLTRAALEAGKAVFVEKPLALSLEELDDVERALSNQVLMVGFNRRHAPLTGLLKEAIEGITDRIIAIRVNAGPLPADHWLHDLSDGGGRLLGEGCHFVDLLSHIAGSPITAVQASAVTQHGRPREASDSLAVLVTFADGGVGSLIYSGAGDPSLPKERIEVFGGGLAAVLDDFSRLELRRGGRKKLHRSAQDKGHRAELELFVKAVRGEIEPPPVETYLAATRATLAIADELRQTDETPKRT